MKTIGRLKEHEALIGQLVRYALTGGLATIVNIGVYWVLAGGGMDPNLAWAFGYVAAVAVGYFVHSHWSFRGHGTRDNPSRTGSRFILVSLVSFGLNQLWVWLLVSHLGLPLWAPYPLVLVATPLVVFVLHRKWVFS